MCNKQSVGIFVVLATLCVMRWEWDASLGYRRGAVTKLYDEHKVPARKSSKQLYSTLARDTLLPGGTRRTQRPRLNDEYLDRFIVVPEYKLLFCYQEKVGCSMFNHLFRMLRLLHPSLLHPSNAEEAAFQAEMTWGRNTPEHHNISKSELEEMLLNASWTKAVFFRDPATRFLSAYRSKCVLKERAKGTVDHCRHSFGRPRIPWGTVPFEHALEELNHQPGKVFDDEHFTPAHTFCGGLDRTLDYYDFVHQLRKPTAPKHIQRLFRRLGVDANSTNYLIQNVVKTGGTALERDEALLRKKYRQGLVQLHASATQQKGHNTGSNKGNALQDSYGRDENLQVIYDRYANDYDLFELPRLGLEGLHNAGV